MKTKHNLQKLWMGVGLVALVMLCLTAAFGNTSVIELAQGLFVGGGALVVKAMAIPVVSINGDVDAPAKAGNLVKAKLYYITADQLDESASFPTRTNREIANLTLKAGEYWHYLKTIHTQHPDVSIGGNVGDVGSTLTNELSAMFGGVNDGLINLIEQKVGCSFYIVLELCDGSGSRYLIGNECSPATLQAPEGGFKKEGASLTLKWTTEGPYLHSIYTGNTPLQTADSIAASATVLAITSNDTYNIAAGTPGTGIITVSGVTDADLNRIITVTGSGDSQIKQDDAGHFLLVEETAWAATAGAQISFKIFKQSGEYKLIEVVGSRS